MIPPSQTMILPLKITFVCDSHRARHHGRGELVHQLARNALRAAVRVRDAAVCGIPIRSFCIFDWKCRDGGELPLKNDEFVLKQRPRIFCNPRYVGPEVYCLKGWPEAKGLECENKRHNSGVICRLIVGSLSTASDSRLTLTTPRHVPSLGAGRHGERLPPHC